MIMAWAAITAALPRTGGTEAAAPGLMALLPAGFEFAANRAGS